VNVFNHGGGSAAGAQTGDVVFEKLNRLAQLRFKIIYIHIYWLNKVKPINNMLSFGYGF